MNNKTLAPIVVFAFNRPILFDQTIKALKKSRLAELSHLYVFVDGPRKENESDKEKIFEIRKIAKKINGFRDVTLSYSDVNKGLANSIISGVSKIINQFGKVIVIEDDLIVSSGFLEFMNYMLNKYEDDQRIFQVSGYGVKINAKKYPYDYYMNIRAHSWTWGTWLNRWQTIDWQVKDFPLLKSDRRKQRLFNRGGSDLYGMLKDYMEHRNNSWYIRFDYAMANQKRFSIMPIRSLVINNGFQEGATHTNVFNRYKVDFNKDGYGDWSKPVKILYNEHVCHQALKYWSIRYRIYGKLMTWLKKIIDELKL